MIHTLLRLSTFYAVFPVRLALGVLCTLLAVAMGLTVPWILRLAVDYGLAQRQPRVFYLAGVMIVAVTAVRGVATFGQHYLAAYLSHQLSYRLRQMLYDKIQRLSFANHDRTRTGDLMSRATADVEAVRLFFQFGLPTIVSLLLTGGGTVVAMALLDWRLALLALGSFPLFLAVAGGIGHLLRPLQGRVQTTTGLLTTTLQESLAGIRVVQAFAGERRQVHIFTELARELYDAYLLVARTQAINLPLLTFLLAFAIALTLYFGGRQVMVGAMSLGGLVAAAGYLAQLTQPMRRLSWLTGMASRCHAGAERLLEVFDTVPVIQERPDARPLPAVTGEVRFEQVCFHYTDGVPVLRDVNFCAAPGQMVALIGATGSGKTTIAQLIPRFYDVTDGRVTLDGIDVRDLQLAALRRHIGVVMQDTILFSATIRDNIAYGRRDLDLDDIVAAATTAAAHDFILDFPDGYDTWVGERGVTLSGGQRQRIAIARALVRDPRILILDDATSSVDMETEWRIQQALTELMAGRTTLVIAHRLRTLKRADLILVIADGRIVQRGTHSALLAQPGLYRRLYDEQLREQENLLLSQKTE